MKNRIKHSMILIFGMFCTTLFYAQQNTFDFEVYEKEKNVFEISLQFYEVANVKFIQVDLIEDGNVLDNQEAILNRKSDNNFYLFYNQKETLVYLDDLKMIIEKKWGKAKPRSIALEVRLLNNEFQLITRNRKQIR
ncbi:hypothetical protein IWQ47_002090 [Aquimarina sp. EL_43]|uniref:hypothetical protein n=1 Tax=unclassified Aquimarina TaxID=2627091 RepID=UPI0018CA60D4|nr:MULTISPECIES: hypothetical protein [unclassified Aquimarina]MBG6130614.1 hypothetical protein [Aquimarina sp. EL_35]MBG6151240.1 hypothetical protein [Aquimarina sp. EL_32]MBG6169016.1 hypothetical protein [Aquimarina sp. EL_43]